MASFTFNNSDGPIIANHQPDGCFDGCNGIQAPAVYPSTIEVNLNLSPQEIITGLIVTLGTPDSQSEGTLFFDDPTTMQVLLVSPNEHAMDIFTGTTSTSLSGFNFATFVLDDNAQSYAIKVASTTGGTFKPTQNNANAVYVYKDLSPIPDPPPQVPTVGYASPGPGFHPQASGIIKTATLNDTFIANYTVNELNGTWKLYVVNTSTANNATIGAWSLTFTTSPVPIIFPNNLQGQALSYLPGGWLSTTNGDLPFYQTINTGAYCANPIITTAQVSTLTSTAISIPPLFMMGGGLFILFSLNYNIPVGNGMLLAISKNGQKSVNITDPSVGGSFPPNFLNINFSQAGYTGVITPGNPLAGQHGWVGNSLKQPGNVQGLLVCLAQIPTGYFNSSGNTTIQLEWQMGIGSNIGGGWGALIDNIQVGGVTLATPSMVSTFFQEGFDHANQPLMPDDFIISPDLPSDIAWVTKGPSSSTTSPNSLFLPESSSQGADLNSSLSTPAFEVPAEGGSFVFDNSFDFSSSAGLQMCYSLPPSTTLIPFSKDDFMMNGYNGQIIYKGVATDVFTGNSATLPGETNGYLLTVITLSKAIFGQQTIKITWNVLYGPIMTLQPPNTTSLWNSFSQFRTTVPRATAAIPIPALGFGSSIGGTITVIPNPIICILKGAMVLTDKGAIKIENLKQGDFVVDESGKFIEVVENYICAMVRKKKTVCFEKGSLGNNKPDNTLRITYKHPIKVNPGDVERNVERFLNKKLDSIKNQTVKEKYMYSIVTKGRHFVNVNNVFVATWDKTDLLRHTLQIANGTQGI